MITLLGQDFTACGAFLVFKELKALAAFVRTLYQKAFATAFTAVLYECAFHALWTKDVQRPAASLAI
jgi:hypothetical protein